MKEMSHQQIHKRPLLKKNSTFAISLYISRIKKLKIKKEVGIDCTYIKSKETSQNSYK